MELIWADHRTCYMYRVLLYVVREQHSVVKEQQDLCIQIELAKAMQKKQSLVYTGQVVGPWCAVDL